MKTEKQIRNKLARIEDKGIFPNGNPYNIKVLPISTVKDYLITWVRKNALGEIQDQNAFYCSRHKSFYLQPINDGLYGLGCKKCK